MVLNPNWNQAKPSSRQAHLMCQRVELEVLTHADERLEQVLLRLRATHVHGGAFMAGMTVGSNDSFDWFASRNRLLEFDILSELLHRQEVMQALPTLTIPPSAQILEKNEACSFAGCDGFRLDNSFRLAGQLTQVLFQGGAYEAKEKISGINAMNLASSYCEAIFGRRYEEVSLYTSYAPWTPWFQSVAWDWTSVLFDRRTRALWILAVTDTD